MRCDTHDHDDNRTGVTVYLDREELSLQSTPFGVVLGLPGMKSGGEPGSPALPRTQVRIAVPAPFWPHELHIDDESWETVVESETFVAASQPLRPGARGSEDAPSTRQAKTKRTTTRTAQTPPAPIATQAVEVSDSDEERGEHTGLHCADDCSCRAPRAYAKPPLTQGFPTPPVVPPDVDAYADAATNPPPAARAVRIETIGTTHVAVVEIAPVRLTAKGGLELCTQLTISIEYAADAPLGHKEAALAELSRRLGKDVNPERVIPLPSPAIQSEREALRLRDLASDLVLNKDIVGPIDRSWPQLDLPSEYLIITDDCQWDAVTIRPGTAIPGIVAAFGRLAAAKRARGISTRIVTITDIVAGRYGDVRSGARDLQEVLRRFIKIAKRRWGVSWLLLGGDTSVVPVREVAGSMLGGIPVESKSSPDDNRSYWTGSYLKMKVVNPGDWWSASTANQLVRIDNGAFIPYDSMGTSSATSPGWFFTASNWTTRSATPTQYVRVNGPASLVNADLMFLYPWNTLPTDFYYASLASWVIAYESIDLGWFHFQIPYVYEPDHDWDAVGNAIYGQHRPDGTDLDGVHLQTDLSVGRAPVDSAAQATTFVDKVLAYEAAGGGVWTTQDREWPTRMVIASSDWGGRSWFSSTASTVPSDGQYHHDAATAHSLLKMKDFPSSFAFELIAHVTDTDRRVMPYKNTDNAAVRGWYFARSATDLRVNELVFSLPWMTFRIPLTSEWIVVHGSLAERTPAAYEFDPTGEDGSMADQETLRKQILSELPAISSFQRLYEDEVDLTLAERFAAPVEYLTATRLEAALDTQPHFMSLSGHGNSNGCCGGSVALAGALTNGDRGFIGYADSCLTNQFDTEDAFSEALVTNPSGGAVGYVGNTRFSWIGVGDNFQRAFFHRLTTTRHLGLLNDSRVSVFGTTGYWQGYERWAIFTLNLLGDPELQVYRAPLPGIRIVVRGPDRVIELHPVPVQPLPGDPWPDPPVMRDILVHVQAGEESIELVTDEAGRVQLPQGFAADGTLTITASSADFVTTRMVVG